MHEGKEMKPFRYEKAEIGTCYYPEHWDKSIWEEDLLRMLSHGIKTIRIAEFSWNKMQPEEGKFDFSFFEEFLCLAEKTGMKVILGTPTATPPAWLANRYPEVLNCRIDGVPLHHGARRHYNYNSPVYRKFCSEIVEKMASAYAGHACVVGWQIDNELNCEVNEFFSESDTIAFRSYLKEKFGTLENLNDCLGTTFWNQTYTDWNQIYVPRTTINNTQNPHFMLEYKRFVSFSALSFAKMQADILRKYIKPTDFITTNGLFGDMDNHTLAREILDTYHYDSYPNFAYMAGSHADDLRDRQWSRYLSEVRSVEPHFGIMEQQSGANGWNTGMEAPSPKPGQISLWSMQSVAHGADYVSYFRWRTSPIGTEIYWHGILDYDNRDNRKLTEIAAFGKRLNKISDIVSEDFSAEFAVIRDYDNIYDSELDVWHGRIDRISMQGLFEAAQTLHAPYDFVYIDDRTKAEQLEKYKVLFYPHAAIMTEARAEILKKYVSDGGTLVLGCRTGYKDIHGRCPFGRVMPGLLTKLTGTEVKEFTYVNPDQVKADFNGKKIEVSTFREILECIDSTPLAHYDGDYFKGETAAAERKEGKGKVLYFGSTFSFDSAYAVIKYLALDEPFKKFISCSKEIELTMRGKYLFVLNYSGKEQSVVLHEAFIDADNGNRVDGEITLNGYATKVYIVR